ISTCIKHLLELIKNAIRVNDDPYRFNINNSSVTYIDIGSNDTDHITIGIDNQEPIELPANYKDKELVRTIINDNIVEKTHDINNKEMIFSALKEIYDGDPGFIFDKISHKLRHTVTEFDESGNSEPTDLFTWYGKDKKGDSLAIVIKNKNGNDYLSLGYYDQDDYHIQRGIRINGDSLTQYCSEKARNASAWFESSKAIMAESFATGSDHQVVNELNGERLREPNEVFKRLGRAIRYNFQVDDAKFRRDNVKEIISNLFANKVDVDHPENKHKDFKDLEDNVEKRLQNRQAKYQNEINQLSAPGVNFDDI
ncbi:TPA: protein YfdF, partial [Escherichia coli]